MNEEYERLLSELTRRGFRFEFAPDCATASRVTSAGGNALDYPRPKSLMGPTVRERSHPHFEIFEMRRAISRQKPRSERIPLTVSPSAR
jgi:hypothetical protein